MRRRTGSAAVIWGAWFLALAVLAPGHVWAQSDEDLTPLLRSPLVTATFWQDLATSVSTSSQLGLSAQDELRFSTRALSFSANRHVQIRIGHRIRVDSQQVSGKLNSLAVGDAQVSASGADSSALLLNQWGVKRLQAQGGVTVSIYQDSSQDFSESAIMVTMNAESLIIDFDSRFVEIVGSDTQPIAIHGVDPSQVLSLEAGKIRIDLEKYHSVLSHGVRFSMPDDGIVLQTQQINIAAQLEENRLTLNSVRALQGSTIEISDDSPVLDGVILKDGVYVQADRVTITREEPIIAFCGRVQLENPVLNLQSDCVRFNLETKELAVSGFQESKKRAIVELNIENIGDANFNE